VGSGRLAPHRYNRQAANVKMQARRCVDGNECCPVAERMSPLHNPVSDRDILVRNSSVAR
jgi:hypothetical protein